MAILCDKIGIPLRKEEGHLLERARRAAAHKYDKLTQTSAGAELHKQMYEYHEQERRYFSNIIDDSNVVEPLASDVPGVQRDALRWSRATQRRCAQAYQEVRELAKQLTEYHAWHGDYHWEQEQEQLSRQAVCRGGAMQQREKESTVLREIGEYREKMSRWHRELLRAYICTVKLACFHA